MPIWPFDRDLNPDRRISDRAGRGSSPRSRWWLPGFGLGLVAVVLVALLPSESALWDFVFLCATLVSLVVLLGAALAMPRGVRVGSPTQRCQNTAYHQCNAVAGGTQYLSP